MLLILRSVLLLCSLLPLAAFAQESSPLLRQVNALRAEHGLPAVPISPALNAVAAAHVRDLAAHPPSGQCNLHSWSQSGSWTSCCYTRDHKQARCMWDKPREITHGSYTGDGFEIAAWYSQGMTPGQALASWKDSDDHLNILLNRGIWSKTKWQAVGGAVFGHYAVVWFGKVAESKTPR